MSSAEEDQHKTPQTKCIFLNYVDTYQGKNFAKYLSQCVIGATLQPAEEEEEETAEDDEEKELEENKAGTYEVIGTLSDPASPKPDFVKEIIKFANKDELYAQLVNCDIIIYDITEHADQIEEATWVASQLHSNLESFDKSKHRTFILVSTVLTWARSKPLDPEDPEIPFTEDDYRRRKPHPNFKEHISAEKMVIKYGKTSKSKLATYVVASGLTYGAGENIFHYLFKAAWHNEPELVCYGKGRNIVPTIHIQDLAAVLQNIADSRPKVHYIIAVDDSKTKLRSIVKAVSKALTTGKITQIPATDALLDKSLRQDHFDMLLVNLRMDSTFVKESMNIKWISETGIVENAATIVKDFKEIRGLLPLRVLITGPPASGKSTVIEQLCSHFKLHHVKIKDVIDEAIANRHKYLEHRAKAEQEQEAKEKAADEVDYEEEDEEVEEEEEEEEEEEDLSGEYEELLETIRESKEQNNGRLDDQLVIKFFREKLLSKPCQNQGFIIDGFPKTLEQAKDLFAADEVEEEAEDENAPPYHKLLMPQLIISLDASDDFLHQRVMNLPENVVVGTHNTEDGLTRRLAEYRALNTDDDTVLNYFDELEFHPEHIDVTTDTSLRMRNTVEAVIKMLGAPSNYGATPEELEEIKLLETEAKIKKEEEEKAELERQEAEEAELRRKRHDEWSQRLEEVRREEHELLEAQSVPLRNYLMKHIMPTLTRGLRDCVSVRPDDPIDFLAEYLFRNNPQVD